MHGAEPGFDLPGAQMGPKSNQSQGFAGPSRWSGTPRGNVTAGRRAMKTGGAIEGAKTLPRGPGRAYAGDVSSTVAARATLATIGVMHSLGQHNRPSVCGAHSDDPHKRRIIEAATSRTRSCEQRNC